MFMTRDHLNASLLDAAGKCRFKVIPKDLLTHALESQKKFPVTLPGLLLINQDQKYQLLHSVGLL